MSSKSNSPEATGCSRRARIGLLTTGLSGMALGEAILVTLLLWPGALQNDVNLGSYLLSIFLVIICSIAVLISLFLLKVHWLLAIGAFLLPLLAAYGQGRLFPNDPTYGLLYWILTYGSGVILPSLILVVSVAVGKGIASNRPQ